MNAVQLDMFADDPQNSPMLLSSFGEGMRQNREGGRMNEKLIEIWLWVVAVAMAVVMVCTAMAWIVGIVVFVMRLING